MASSPRPPKGRPEARLRFNQKDPAGRLREAIDAYRAALGREPDPPSGPCEACGEIMLLAALTVDEATGRGWCPTCLADRAARQLRRFRGL